VLILLADISFKTTYSRVYTYPVDDGGVPPIDLSVQNTTDYSLQASYLLWNTYSRVFLDPLFYIEIPPRSCSGSDCLSYYFPGGTGLNVNGSVWDWSVLPQANAGLYNDYPGYQVEFYPPASSDPAPSAGECGTYGQEWWAIQLCIVKEKEHLIAGFKPN
jgi:hypothetical protein